MSDAHELPKELKLQRALLADQSSMRDHLVSHRTSADAQPYSHFVSMMKVILPALAAITLVAVFVTLQTYNQAAKDWANNTPTFPYLESDIHMLEPKLTSRDRQGRPFEVTATTAVRQSENADILDLDEIVGKLYPNSDKTEVTQPGQDKTVILTSDRGTYNKKLEKLLLNGNVIVTQADDFKVKTEQAIVDLESNEAYGTVRTHVELSWADVESNSFRVMDDAKRIKFHGKVRTVVYPSPETPRVSFNDQKHAEAN